MRNLAVIQSKWLFHLKLEGVDLKYTNWLPTKKWYWWCNITLLIIFFDTYHVKCSEMVLSCFVKWGIPKRIKPGLTWSNDRSRRQGSIARAGGRRYMARSSNKVLFLGSIPNPFCLHSVPRSADVWLLYVVVSSWNWLPVPYVSDVAALNHALRLLPAWLCCVGQLHPASLLWFVEHSVDQGVGASTKWLPTFTHRHGEFSKDVKGLWTVGLNLEVVSWLLDVLTLQPHSISCHPCESQPRPWPMAPRGRPYKRVHHITGKKQHGMASEMAGLFGALPRAESSQSRSWNGILEGAKTSQPLERFPERLETQGLKQPALERLTDLQLQVPNSSFLGYFGQLQDQLRGIALASKPLISPSRLLDTPDFDSQPAFLWKTQQKQAPTSKPETLTFEKPLEPLGIV